MATLATPSPAAERILEGLTPSQRAAVLHEGGPLLILAGAGTGKTTVLTRRIAHLISSKKARPEEILALTFTEKAAVEMAERVDELIPYGYAETWIGTFHAFGDRILREAALEAGLNPEFRVLTRPEQIIFLRERLFRLPLRRFRPLGDPTQHLSALLDVVSRAKDEHVSPEAFSAHAKAKAERARTPEDEDAADRDSEIAAFYSAYQALLRESGVADFGDQIHEALVQLEARPDLLRRQRERYPVILVDEFQDTNHAQLEMVRLLAGEGSPRITVVGDDDQAIYRWRGAAAANLLAFRKLYPGAAQVVLNENHRSSQPILDAASRLVSYNNPYRLEVIAGVDKRLRSGRPSGPPVRHAHCDTVSAEADFVAAAIEERLGRGMRPRDFGILVRSNGDADPFLRALNMKGIPSRFSGSRGLYAREEVRLLVCFLKVLANPQDSVSLFYLASSEVYGVPELDLLRLNHESQRKTRPLLETFRALETGEAFATAETRERTKRLLADLEEAAKDVPGRRTGEVLYAYLQRSGFLARLAAQGSAAAEAKVKNIARFFETVKAYGDVADHDRVPSFVEHLTLLREAGDDPAVAEADPDEDAVHLMTVHKAKGLEFPVVILVGLAEARFPLRRRGESLELPTELTREEAPPGDAHLHEERRLFYVAMTRAQEELLLTSASDYGTERPRKVSRFVREALDLPSPVPKPRRSAAIEAIGRHKPREEALPGKEGPLPASELLRLSFQRVDDYETCPLKYRYVHVLKVPLLAHHRVVFGSAIHKAVQQHFRARKEGIPFGEEDLLAAFRSHWVSEGFLSREHEEERLRSGEEMLRRFHRQDAQDPLLPTGVEEEFAFFLGRTRVSGRYDLVVERSGEATILDFKTGPTDTLEKAQRRAQESLQLDIYALAFLKTRGKLPSRVELRFLESGLRAGRTPTLEGTEDAAARIEAAASGIRARDFAPRPSFMACSYCPFREICPHTARGPEAEPQVAGL
jgi:DNA helicase-2/ATP-dependent DNA helicase PcrA